MNKIKKVYGFFAYIDALGISSYDIDQLEEFIRKIYRFLSDIKEKFTKENLIGTGYITENMDPPNFSAFADTIVFSWEIKDPRMGYLLNAMDFLKDIICWFSFEPWLSSKDYNLSRKNTVMFRGALSIGDYVIGSHKTNNIILGHAVSDAANWFEKADWQGIIITPKCQAVFEQNIKNKQDIKKISKDIGEPLNLKRHFVKYPVPLKCGKTENLWVVSWPYKVIELFEKDKNRELARNFVCNNYPNSENARQKLCNTSKFFNWYLDKIYDDVKQHEDKVEEYLNSHPASFQR